MQAENAGLSVISIENEQTLNPFQTNGNFMRFKKVLGRETIKLVVTCKYDHTFLYEDVRVLFKNLDENSQVSTTTVKVPMPGMMLNLA